ncbi:MAG TPA: hypothetical protein VD993_06250 [Chitinophagaceae bacterium]|nr:hypothetical protein [Chitinophagaceae bacterium]
MLKTKPAVSKERMRCRKKFLYYFKKGFNDPTYLDWERNYKWQAHLAWEEQLNREAYERQLQSRRYADIANTAVRIESRTNLLFSFEKMALRDAVKTPAGAKAFAEGLFNYIYADDPLQDRFEAFTEVLASLPRKQTRVLTWPLQTVFGFIGNPDEHIFLKPRVTKIAAEKYGYDFQYTSRPNWKTYQNLLAFAEEIGADQADLQPRDLIDMQSFMWVLGSDEYPD